MKKPQKSQLYKFLAISCLILTPFIDPLEARQSIHIDGSGNHGRDGTNGQSYSTHPGASSGRGRDGGDATTSSAGADGRDIDLFLKSLSPNNVLQGRNRR